MVEEFTRHKALPALPSKTQREQLENRRWLDLERELDWKEQKNQQMSEIHEKNFTVPFQSQKKKNSD